LPRSRIIRPDDTLPVEPEMLLREYQQLVFHKAAIDVFVNPHLGRLIDRLKVGQYIVFGVATDYCVATMTEGLLARRASVALVTDAIRPLDENQADEVLRQFAERGVQLIRTAEVVHEVDDDRPPVDYGEDE